MAQTDSQKTDLLWKKQFGVSETQTTKQFFEEANQGRPTVFPTQIWADYAKIPTTAPGGGDGVATGVVTRYIARSMTAEAGTTNSFKLAALKNTIPFNFGDGSYNYVLTDSGGTTIPFGQNDWVVDTEAGTLTFFNGIPSNMPPKISFYAYTGAFGAASDAVGETPQTLTENTANQTLTGFLFTPGATAKTIILEAQIYRSSTSTGAVELIGYTRMGFQWKPTIAQWYPTTFEQMGDDTGVSFDINASGQIRATTTLITGTSPTTVVRARAKGFNL